MIMPPSRLTAAIIVLLLSTALLLYWPAFQFSFVYLDDHIWCSRGQWFLKNPRHWIDMLTGPDFLNHNYFRPMTNISFFIDTQIGGGKVWVYRLSNILLHTACATGIFLCLKRMRYSRWHAAGAALLFTAHPLLQDAIAWIPGRTDLLPGVFIIFSFLFWIKWTENPRNTTLAMHCCLGLLGLLSKETMLVFPVLCAIWTWASPASLNGRQWRSWVICWCGIIAAWGLWRTLVLHHSGGSLSQEAGIPLTLLSLTKLALASGPLALIYCGKVFWPSHLTAIFTTQSQSLIPGCLSVGGITLSLFFSRSRNNRRIIFAILWCALFLIPPAMAGIIKHEYRMYIPMMGIIILGLETDLFKPGTRVHSVIQIIIATACLCALVAWHYTQLGRFKNREIFWINAVTDAPNSSFAHCQLGLVCYNLNDFRGMEREMRLALKINPHEKGAHVNLGLIYYTNRQWALAKDAFQTEINIHPEHAFAYYMMGLLQQSLEDPRSAVEWFEKTLKKDPLFIPAAQSLVSIALVLHDEGRARRYDTFLKKQGAPMLPEWKNSSLYQRIHDN
jgi:hypothetical protein